MLSLSPLRETYQSRFLEILLTGTRLDGSPIVSKPVIAVAASFFVQWHVSKRVCLAQLNGLPACDLVDCAWMSRRTGRPFVSLTACCAGSLPLSIFQF